MAIGTEVGDRFRRHILGPGDSKRLPASRRGVNGGGGGRFAEIRREEGAMMKKHAFGPTGRQVAVVGQGTWELERDAAAAITALRRGLDA